MSLLSEIQNAPATLSQNLLFCFHFSLVWENRNAATIWAILVILVSCIPIYGATCKIHSILCIVFSGCERSCKLTSLDLRGIELSYENETMPHHWALNKGLSFFSVASKSSVDIVSIWWSLHTNPFLCWSLLKGGEIVSDQFLLFTTCHYSLAGCGAFPRPHCFQSSPALSLSVFFSWSQFASHPRDYLPSCCIFEIRRGSAFDVSSLSPEWKVNWMCSSHCALNSPLSCLQHITLFLLSNSSHTSAATRMDGRGGAEAD